MYIYMYTYKHSWIYILIKTCIGRINLYFNKNLDIYLRHILKSVKNLYVKYLSIYLYIYIYIYKYLLQQFIDLSQYS